MDFIVLTKTLNAAIAIFDLLNRDLRNLIWKEGHEDRQQRMRRRRMGDCEDGTAAGHHHDDDDSEEVSSSSLSSTRYLNVLDRILERCHVPVLKDLHERLISIVDYEATVEMKESVVIHYGFHEELDNAKEMFDHLDGE